MFCAALHCGVLNQGASNANGGEQEETRLDLRSRGLCLVPLSCTSYVTNENGVWAPPNFRGNWFMPARDTTTGQCIGTNWRLIRVLPAKKEKKMYPLSLCCLSTSHLILVWPYPHIQQLAYHLLHIVPKTKKARDGLHHELHRAPLDKHGAKNLINFRGIISWASKIYRSWINHSMYITWLGWTKKYM